MPTQRIFLTVHRTYELFVEGASEDAITKKVEAMSSIQIEQEGTLDDVTVDDPSVWNRGELYED